MDKTKWYTIDYERLETLELTSPVHKIHEDETEIDPTEPENTSEMTPQKTSPVTDAQAVLMSTVFSIMTVTTVIFTAHLLFT